MKTLLASLVLLLVTTIFLSGCQKAADTSASKQYPIHGKVVAADMDRKAVTLDHDDIPGLMQGMEMEFQVDNPQLLESLNAGDEVRGQVEVRSGAIIVTDLHKQ